MYKLHYKLLNSYSVRDISDENTTEIDWTISYLDKCMAGIGITAWSQKTLKDRSYLFLDWVQHNF